MGRRSGEVGRWGGAPLLELHGPRRVGWTGARNGLAKEGLRAPGVGEQVGELYLADIGVPPALYARPGLGLKVGPIFGQSEIVRVE